MFIADPLPITIRSYSFIQVEATSKQISVWRLALGSSSIGTVEQSLTVMKKHDKRSLASRNGRASQSSAQSDGNFRVWPQRRNTGCKETNGSLRRPRAQCVDWSRRGNRERSDSGTYAAGNPDRLALSWRGRFGWGPSLRLVQ